MNLLPPIQVWREPLELVEPEKVKFHKFVYRQTVPARTWIIKHNLPSKEIAVSVYDEIGVQLRGFTFTIMDGQVRLDFGDPCSGQAILVC